MIYTLTTNPAIDMNICTKGLAPCQVNRTFDEVYTPNGKGLNVSFALQHFGVDSCILGFFGGFSGRYIVDASREKGALVKPVWIEGTTRINIFLNDGTTEYKLVNQGAFVSREKQEELLALLDKAEDMDLLSISGSLPPGISEDFYDEVLSLCRRKGTRVILDISSPRLAELLAYRPLLIKPNDEELKKIFGFSFSKEEETLQAMENLYKRGAQNILLTMGDKGAYFYDGKEARYASARPVKLLSSACAGDAALAGFLSRWLPRPSEVDSALARMAATGANVAESNALGDFGHVDAYEKEIVVRRI